MTDRRALVRLDDGSLAELPAGDVLLGAAPGVDGLDGAPGAGLNPVAAWDIGTAYAQYDLVSHNGASYWAVDAHTGSAPPSVHWQLFADKGAPGEIPRAEAVARDQPSARFNEGAMIFGCPTPATAAGTAGNFSYRFMKTSESQTQVRRIFGFPKNGGGPAVLRVLIPDPADDTQLITYGPDFAFTLPAAAFDWEYGIDFDEDIVVPPGGTLMIFAFSGTGKLALNTAGAPYTPYMVLGPNFTGGALGSVTNASGPQIGFEMAVAGGEMFGRMRSILARTGQNVIWGPASCLVDLGQTHTNASVYWPNSRVPTGLINIIEMVGRTQAGWMTLLLSRDHDGFKRDKYASMHFDIAIGPNTFLAGEDFPRGTYSDNAMVGIHCPAAGGQLSYTSLNVPAGETVPGALLSNGSYTSTASLGLETFTFVPSQTRLFSLRLHIEKPSGEVVVVSPELVDADFTGNERPRDLYAVGSWTYIGGQAVSGSTGMANVLRGFAACAFHNVDHWIEFEFQTAVSEAYISTIPAAGSYGSMGMPSPITNDLTIYKSRGAGTTVPAVRTTIAWDPAFDPLEEDHLYRYHFRRRGRVVGQRMIDGERGIAGAKYDLDLTPAQVPPLVATASESLDYMGMAHGTPGIAPKAGGVNVIRVWSHCPDLDAPQLHLGDSTANASRVAYTDGCIQRIRAERQALGLRTAIAAIDGWNSNSIRIQLLEVGPRMRNLRRVCITGGANDGSLAVFTAQAAAILSLCQDNAWELIWETPAIDNVNTPLAADFIAVLESMPITLVRRDRRLTVNGDGVTKDVTKFHAANDVHENLLGNDERLDQWHHDAPQAFC